jgi:hypothetical protein
LVRDLYDGPKGSAVVERIDRRVDRLPGQCDLHLLSSTVAKVAGRAWAA